jgi:hypothetical protein
MIAGIAAGGFGRAVASRDASPSPIPGLLAMGVLAAIGPLTGLFITGKAQVATAAMEGRVFPLAVPMPLDWLAGALWGIPLGLSWADSMVEKHGSA